MGKFLARKHAPEKAAATENPVSDNPAERNAIYSASLKQARNLIDAGFPGFAIISVLLGIEYLLEALFVELRDHSNWRKQPMMKAGLKWEYRDKIRQRKYTHKQDSSVKLTVFGWLALYEDATVFEKLEEQFAYSFHEFNLDNLHYIRRSRNEIGHSLEQAIYQVRHKNDAERIVRSYESILFETERIRPTAAVILVDDGSNNNVIALETREKEALASYFEAVLRSNPRNNDLQFLRQFLTTIPTVEAGRPGLISQLDRDQQAPNIGTTMRATRGEPDYGSGAPRIQVLNLFQRITNINISLRLPSLRWRNLTFADKVMLNVAAVLIIVVVAVAFVLIALGPGLLVLISDLLAVVRDYVGELLSGNRYASALTLVIVLLLVFLVVRRLD